MAKFPINKRRRNLNRIFWGVMIASAIFIAYCIGWVVAWVGSCACKV